MTVPYPSREAQLQDLRDWFIRCPEELAKADRRRQEWVARWPDLVVIRTDRQTVDLAICRALGLTVEATMCRLEVANHDTAR
jgi:hypothetical protein